MSDAEVRTWTGGAYWYRRGERLWTGGLGWTLRHAGWPMVKLRMHEVGGRLLLAMNTEILVEFQWSEVKELERVRVFALPFLGEGVRFTFEEMLGLGVPKRFLFFSGSKGRTMDILGLAESRGVRVERRARNILVVP